MRPIHDAFYRSVTLLLSFFINSRQVPPFILSRMRGRALDRCLSFISRTECIGQITKAARIFCFEYPVRWRDTMCQETFYCIFAKQAHTTPLLHFKPKMFDRHCFHDTSYDYTRKILRWRMVFAPNEVPVEAIKISCYSEFYLEIYMLFFNFMLYF